MDDTDKREQEQAEFEATEAKRRRKVKAKASVPSDLDTVRAKAGAGDAVTAAGTSEGARKGWEHRAQSLTDHAEKISKAATMENWKVVNNKGGDRGKLVNLHKEARQAHDDAAEAWKEGGFSTHHFVLSHKGWAHHHAIGAAVENKASDASEDNPDAVHCRAEASVALSAAEPWKQDEPVRFIYAPAGVHTITAGFREGRITMTVVVDEETPSALQASFKAVAGRRSQTPFADEEHEAHKATLRFPKDGTEFGWGTLKDSTGVVLAGGLPTSYGAEAVNGRTYESWSPEFLTDADYAKARVSDDGHYTFPNGVRGSASNPARLVGVGFTIGALTNKPAFHMMPPVKAGDAAKATDGEVKATWSDAARRAALEARRTKGHQQKMLDWDTRKEQHHTHEVSDGVVTYHTKAPKGMSMHDIATHFLKGYDDGGTPGPVEFHVVNHSTGEHGDFSGHPNNKAESTSGIYKASDASHTASVRAASPGLGFCKLAGLAAGLQVAHWAADTVTNAHKAIGDLYETVSAKVDEFAEVYSGKTGEVPLAGESCEVKAVGDHTELVEQGLATVEEVRGVLGGGDDDLLNILADIEAAYNKARYLLKATEGSGAVVLADKGRGETVTASTILDALSGRRSEAVLAKLRGEAEPPKPPPTSEEILARLGQTGARPNN